MAPDDLPGDCWPTRAQTWLLRAALLPGEPGWQAWQVWREHAGGLETLDAGSWRLLPLLYSNLRAHGIADPLLARLKALYRETWFHNQALFHQVADLLECLQAAAIDTLVLKGAALCALHYREPGLRPMVDCDILVPAAQAPRAFDELERLGWRRTLNAAGNARQMLDVRQALEYAGPDGCHFDLHWHALWECCFPGADDAFWAGAVPVQINHVTARALNPTDQLLHVCVHGASLNQVPPVRWAADAVQVLRTPGAPIDWARLLGQAERLRLSLPLRDTFRFLKTNLEAPIPDEVVNALDAVPVSAGDREFYRLKISRRGLLGEIPVWWQHYRLLSQARQRPVSRAGFLRYLRLNWGLDDGRAIPGFVLDKAIRRVKAVSARPPAVEP